MLDHVLDFDPAKVRERQPWLSDEQVEHAERFGREFMENMRSFSTQFEDEREPWMGDETETSSDVFRKAKRRFGILTHFILTDRFEIVEEPNPVRWGMFLELGRHRQINRTYVNEGPKHPRVLDSDWPTPSWRAQQREKRKRRQPPSFKSEEVFVSTVFIGTCPEELFETMIFGGWMDGTRWKDATLLDAKKCHFAAVSLARAHLAYMKRHAKARRKDWVRLERFWRMAHKRGKQWALNRLLSMSRVDERLRKIPGEPSIPEGNMLCDLASMFLSRPTLVENPLVENPSMFGED